MEQIAAYHLTGVAMAAAGALMLLQLLVADAAAIKAKHIPGTPVEPNHENFLFRASRSLANMNESVAVFIIFALVGILSAADPLWLGRLAWVYIAARAAYMLCYWFNIKLMRSVFFGISLFALLGLGGIMGRGLMG
ncbi:MAG: MAPEG family protein [Robiginitomaculum sp.]|nr:MAPEG family protein [Robiginitomaculum sp.]